MGDCGPEYHTGKMILESLTNTLEQLVSKNDLISPLFGINLRKMSMAHFVTTQTGAVSLLPRGVHSLHYF